MTRERWQRIKSILEAADTASPADRTAILDRLCDCDAQLREEVERYLIETSGVETSAAERGGGELIQDVIARSAAELTPEDFRPTDALERVGPYELIRLIGRGGMGAVYEAVRVDAFRKRVALKIIKHGLDSEFARARVQQERQVLASLEHPYIARLLDGGETKSGSPYLVLEFVDGEPIDTFCARVDRTPTLRLFLKVCEAVEYAHRNLVVHRDLKPANIFVTAEGDPRLLDFGIAKLLDPAATATQTGVLALTPDYASPEQVRGGTISTATDIYSLGVVLYQLLTGRKPYSFTTLTPSEIDRVVCEADPPAPGVSSDLDNIILMAMRKEPERRYGSVQQFAEDIRRSLDNRPVTARPDTFGYRTGRYARRHWVGLTSVGIASAGLLIGSGIALQQAHRAERHFLQVRTMANKFLFDFSDDIQFISGTTKAREHMVSTARDYLDSLASESGNDRQLQMELAIAYRRVGTIQGLPNFANLGQSEPALVSFNKAAAILEQLARRDRARETLRQLASVYTERASLLQYLSRPQEALASATQGSQITDELLAHSPELADFNIAASTTTQFANLRMAARDTKGALDLYRQASDSRRRAAEADPSTRARYAYATTLEHAGAPMALSGDFPGALESYRKESEIVDLLERDNPTDPRIKRLRLLIYQNAGNVWGTNEVASLMQRDKGLEYFRKMNALAEEMHVADPHDKTALSDVINSLIKPANVLFEMDPHEAIRLDERALTLIDQLPAGPQHDYMRASALTDLVQGFGTLRNFAAAHKALDEGEALIRKQTGNMATQGKPDRNLAVVYFRHAALGIQEKQFDLARENTAKYLSLTEDGYREHPESLFALYDLSYGWDLMTAIDQEQLKWDAVKAGQQKKLDAWRDWDARYIPNAYSKVQREDAEAGLNAVTAHHRVAPARH